jgi:hypothetical protein
MNGGVEFIYINLHILPNYIIFCSQSDGVCVRCIQVQFLEYITVDNLDMDERAGIPRRLFTGTHLWKGVEKGRSIAK